MQKSHQRILLLIFLLLLFGYCLRRDILIESQYTPDLRNRIVGARLQMDGKSPYFYCWNKGDSMRYYDPINCTSRVSIITASPFFHHLLYPLANLPGREISRIWLCVEYLMLISCLMFAFSYSRNLFQDCCIAVFFAPFLFTEAWIVHISFGQYYIIFPFLAFVFLFCIQRNKYIPFSIVAGLAAVSLMLIKPTFLLFFLPFVMLIKKYPIKNILFFFLPIIVLVGYSVLDKNERAFWMDYGKAIKMHIQNHLGYDSAPDNGYNAIKYENWDGWDMDQIRQARTEYALTLHGECFNTWVFVNKIFDKKVPVIIINLISFFVITGMLIFFYVKQKDNTNLSLLRIAVFGFCLYATSEFLSPITRYQYYGVQWLFPLLLLSAYYDKRFRIIYSLLLVGLLLNILNTPYLKMRHNIGEIIILFTLLWICFSKRSLILK